MINPSDESFWASKTMCLLCIGMGAIVLLVVLGVLVKVLFGVDAFQLVSTGILGVSGHSGAGAVRNTMIDGQTRAANAAQATGITPGQMQTPASPPIATNYGPPSASQ